MGKENFILCLTSRCPRGERRRATESSAAGRSRGLSIGENDVAVVHGVGGNIFTVSATPASSLQEIKYDTRKKRFKLQQKIAAFSLNEGFKLPFQVK